MGQGRQPTEIRKKKLKPFKKTDNSSHFRNVNPEIETTSWILGGLYSVVGVAAISIVAWFVYQGYLETRVNTPLNEPRIITSSGLQIPDRYWGSYRPGVYFGLKTRDPQSLLVGLMWLAPNLLHPSELSIRHLCDQRDNLKQYGWIEHDGRNFGVQEILDSHIKLETSFIKKLEGDHGGEWASRIRVLPLVPMMKGEQFTLFFYLTLDDDGKGLLQPIRAIDNMDTSTMNTNQSIKYLGLSSVYGHTEKLGDFRVRFYHQSEFNVIHTAYLSSNIPGPHLVKEALQNGLRLMEDKRSKQRHISLAGTLFTNEDTTRQSNFVVHQVTGKVPFDLEVVYESQNLGKRESVLRGDIYDGMLENYRQNFAERFEAKFQLFEKGFNEEETNFAKAAFSNLIGSIGYFYGSSKVQSQYNKEPVPYWNAPLYTAVPSRSFFPRGFLWDEGFHNLLLLQWDRDISFDIIGHWFDLMNIEGWIPREQILGSEARSRVPDEFVIQKNNNGNPPTFLLALDSLITSAHGKTLDSQEFEFFQRLWPRLVTWFNWFNVSQLGTLPGTYHWRGRDASTIRELNPKSLSSGLDDYPRSSHPTKQDRHLDLRCWICLSSRVIARIADIVGRDSRRYHETYEFLSDIQLLNQQHWSSQAKRYVDYGLHSSNVTLKRPKLNPGQPKPEKVRVVYEDPVYRFVDDTFGYVSLFPLITQILQPDAPHLEQLLLDIRNPNLLWTKYGLRSLAKNAPLYNKRNTEHDPPYWRGAIWVNINYLVVRALYHYSKLEGPYQMRAEILYNELRENLIRNILYQYRTSGYIWEQYSDITGAGQGCRPFTGWSSLILLIMSEKYD